MKLNMLPVGARARITAYEPSSNTSGLKAYRQKCLSMGLTPGATFKVIARAPLGCPIEIEIRGYSLSLRTQESQVLICEHL